MISDQHLAGYIENIFNHYDKDHSQGLDACELTGFFNDLYRAMGINKTVTVLEAQNALASIDKNHDGRASKQELYEAFKKVLVNEGAFVNGQQVYSNTGQGYH